MKFLRSLSLLAIPMIAIFFPIFASASSQKLLYSFAGGSDGSYPVTPLVADAAGNLYGSTQLGGGGTGCNEGTMGCGVVFELSPPTGGGAWTEKVLYSFAGGGNDGEFPSGLAFDAHGNLFGTTLFGGTGGNGNVFELSPNSDGTWTKSVVYTFNGGTTDGCEPYYGVIFDGAGNLYGTNVGCSTYNSGTVYELTPTSSGPWTETILYSFTGGADGYFPGVLALDSQGNLFGTNEQGGTSKNGAGTVYELQPGSGSWTFTLLHNFTAGSDGFYPSIGLALDSAGNVYGVTQSGGGLGKCGTGKEIGCGTAFRFARQSGGTWKYEVLHRFAGTPAKTPIGPPIFAPSGVLYDTCADSNSVFSLAANGSGGLTFTNLLELEGAAFPDAGVISDAAGNLYGTADTGGANNLGAVFEVTP